MAAVLELRLPRRAESVREARRLVESAVSTAHPGASVDDLMVAVSELCTNVIEHTDGSDFDLHIEVGDDEEEFEICTNGGQTPTTYEGPRMPPPTSLRGRGLALVDSLVDHLLIHLLPDGGWRVKIRTSLPATPSGGFAAG